MNQVSETSIQGLFSAESSGQSFWSLKARVELSVFSENHVETLGKENKKAYPNHYKRSE